MRIRRALLHRLGLVGFGLLFALGLWMVQLDRAPVGEHDPSVASSAPDGRQTAFRLLRELGFEPESWRQAPLALPAGNHVLWIPDLPRGFADEEARDRRRPSPGEGDVDPVLADPRHPWNYARFIEGGGTVVIRGGPAEREWLLEEVGIELPPWNGLRRDGEILKLDLEGGERLEVTAELAEGASDEREERDDRWRDVAIDGAGGSFAAWASVGSGRVVLLADDRFLRNDSIGEADNGLFLVRLSEALDRDGRLLFDEYALGRWSPPSSLSLLAAPGLLEVTLHASLLVLFVALLAAWAREFPRDPEARPANPRARAAAQAAMLERARRYDLLAEDLRLGVLRRLLRHGKLTRSAASLREGTDPETVAALAREAAVRAGVPERAERWAHLFAGVETERRRDWIELAGALAELEDRTGIRGRTAGRGQDPGR